jgi:amidase
MTCSFPPPHRHRHRQPHQIDAAKAVSPADVAWAEAAHDDLLASRDAFFAAHDLLAVPSAVMSPFPVETTWPRGLNGAAFPTYIDWLLMAGAVSLLGGPAIALPCGVTAGGMPVGLSLVGPPGSERRVLRAAAAFEVAHAWRAGVPRDPAAARGGALGGREETGAVGRG